MKKTFPKIYRRLPKKQTGDMLSLLLGSAGTGNGMQGNTGNIMQGITGLTGSSGMEGAIGGGVQGATGLSGIPTGAISQGLSGIGGITKALTGNQADMGLNKDLNAKFKPLETDGSVGIVMNLANKLLGEQINKDMEVDPTGIDYYKNALQNLEENKQMIAQQGKLLPNPNYQRIFGDLNNRYNSFIGSQNIEALRQLQKSLRRFQDTQELQSQVGTIDNTNNSNLGEYNFSSNPNVEQEALEQWQETQRLQNQGAIPSDYIPKRKTTNNSSLIEEDKQNQLKQYLERQLQETQDPIKQSIIRQLQETMNNEKGNSLLTESSSGNLGSSQNTEASKRLQETLNQLREKLELENQKQTALIKNISEGTKNEENTNDKRKKGYDPLKLQMIGMLGEGVLNTIQGITSAIGANDLFIKLQKLKNPRLVLPNTVRGAELADTTNTEQQVRNQIQQANRNISANTGNLQALIGATTNTAKQGLYSINAIRQNALAMYQKDKQGELQELGQLTKEQAVLNNKYQNDEVERKRKAIQEMIKIANATKQSAVQNILGIGANLANLLAAKQKDIEKIDLAIAGYKTQLLDELKQKREYYYKTDANGNIVKDENGNPIRTTPEEKRRMEQEVLANVENDPTYAELLKLRDIIDEQGRLFPRNKEQANSTTKKEIEKAQKGKKVKTEQSVIDTILSNYVDLKHKKETALSLQRNKQLYDASKDAVNFARKLFSQLYR